MLTNKVIYTFRSCLDVWINMSQMTNVTFQNTKIVHHYGALKKSGCLYYKST